MIRWYPMARATSKLAGRPVVFDLTKISYLTVTVPDYQPIVRDIETIRRTIRRKQFGVRPSAQVGFKVPHSRTLNTAARWYDWDGLNLLRSPFDLTISPWSLSNATLAASPAKDPRGTFTAFRMTDSSGAAIGLLFENTAISAATFTGLFSVYARADAPHVFSIGIQDNAAEATDVDVDAESTWRRVSVRKSFTNAAANFQAMIRPTQLTASLQGAVDLFWPQVRKIVELPGTDEEVLGDLADKLKSDDWDMELTLDGGLTWRRVLLEEHQKIAIEDKWVGYSERFSFIAAEVIQQVPATLDGVW
jgi:hypothetical protein